MKLRNNFSDLTRALYIQPVNPDDEYCWICKSNQSCELHHILGRVSNSPFNSCCLCRKCHENYTKLDKGKLLRMAIKFCLREQYTPTEKDIKFYRDNKKLYGS